LHLAALKSKPLSLLFLNFLNPSARQRADKCNTAHPNVKPTCPEIEIGGAGQHGNTEKSETYRLKASLQATGV